MKKALLFTGTTAVAICLSTLPALTSSGGAPTGRSGSPSSNGTTCATSGCHTGGPAISSQTISITSDIPATGFAANTDYTITISADANGAVGSEIGFQASVENESGAHQGDLTISDARTRFAGPAGNYVTHKSTGLIPVNGVNSWDFTWNSGNAEDSSMVYVAVNFANDNNTTTGDAVGTQTLLLRKDNGIGLDENAIASEFVVFPNPMVDRAELAFSLKQNAEVSYSIIDMNGKVMTQNDMGQRPSGVVRTTLSANGWASGVYFLHVRAGDQTHVERLIVR